MTIWDIRVVFYRGDEPLNEAERPHMQFTSAGGGRTSFSPLNRPPRVPVSSTIFVTTGYNEANRQRAVEEAERVLFEAIIE